MSKKVQRGASIAALLTAAFLGVSSLISKEEQIVDKQIKELKTEIVETTTKARTSTTPITRNSTWTEALSQIEKLAQKRTRLNKLKEEVNETLQSFNERQGGKRTIPEIINSRKNIKALIGTNTYNFKVLTQLSPDHLKIWIKLQNKDSLSEEEDDIYVNKIKPKFLQQYFSSFQKTLDGFWLEEDPYESRSYLQFANDLFVEFLVKAEHDLITGIDVLEEALKVINYFIEEIEEEGDPEEITKEELNKLYNDKLYFEETVEGLKDDLSSVQDAIDQRKDMKF